MADSSLAGVYSRAVLTPGIHLIHKPAGPSSFAVLQEYVQSRRIAGDGRPLRVCHGGALDPFASGLLLVLVEPATRLFDHLHDIPKVYEATVRWGTETDTGDPLGKTAFSGDPTGLAVDAVEAALAGFIGWTEQLPPSTSNKRVDGERAYEKAHRGEEVALPPVRAYLHAATWLAHDLPRTSRLRVVVRGGFYVRALVRDIGRKLGCGAHLTQLKRLMIGPWADPGVGQSAVITGRQVLPWLGARGLTAGESRQIRQGLAIERGDVAPPDWPRPSAFEGSIRVVRGFEVGKLVCLLQETPNGLEPRCWLPGGI